VRVSLAPIKTVNGAVTCNCPYCGVHVAFTLASTTAGAQVFAVWQQNNHTQWWIGICPSCNNAALVCDKHVEGRLIVYPNPKPSRSDEHIPDAIRRDLDGAKLCFSVSAHRASAVIARRTIQAICLDKGATKGNLIEQLHDLASKGVITKELKDWGDVVRW
jgi:hypothetical protein